MTEQERITRLAEWMGWELQPPDIDSPQGWWKNSPNELDVEEWNPVSRIHDAWMLIEKARRMLYQIHIGWSIYGEWKVIFSSGIKDANGYSDKASEAIVNAVEKIIES